MDPTPVILHRLQNQVDNEDWPIFIINLILQSMQDDRCWVHGYSSANWFALDGAIYMPADWAICRATLTNDEYEALCRAMRTYTAKYNKLDDSELRVRKIVQHYVLIAANSG